MCNYDEEIKKRRKMNEDLGELLCSYRAQLDYTEEKIAAIEAEFDRNNREIRNLEKQKMKTSPKREYYRPMDDIDIYLEIVTDGIIHGFKL